MILMNLSSLSIDAHNDETLTTNELKSPSIAAGEVQFLSTREQCSLETVDPNKISTFLCGYFCIIPGDKSCSIAQ